MNENQNNAAGTPAPEAAKPVEAKTPWYKSTSDWIESHPITTMAMILTVGIAVEATIMACKKS